MRRRIAVIGAPVSIGGPHPGTEAGPAAIREAGLLRDLEAAGIPAMDLGDVPVGPQDDAGTGEPRMRGLRVIAAAARRLSSAVAGAISAGDLPLVLGGDHSLALGSIAGAAEGRRIGVLWIDAHPDFNTPETTPSGNIHGMPLAALCGKGAPLLAGLGRDRAAIAPANVALLGVRDRDAGEAALLEEAGIAVISAAAWRDAPAATLARALEVAGGAADGIYVSVDLDVLDPQHAPGVSLAVNGGLSLDELCRLCAGVAATGRVLGVDLAELNPAFDRGGRTAAAAKRVALSLLGCDPERLAGAPGRAQRS